MTSLSGALGLKMLPSRLSSGPCRLVSSHFTRSFSRESAAGPRDRPRNSTPRSPAPRSPAPRSFAPSTSASRSWEQRSDTSRSSRPSSSTPRYSTPRYSAPAAYENTTGPSRSYNRSPTSSPTRSPTRSPNAAPSRAPAAAPFDRPITAATTPPIASRISRKEKDLLKIQENTGLVSDKEKRTLAAKEEKRARWVSRMQTEYGDNWEAIVATLERTKAQTRARLTDGATPVKKKNRWTQQQKDEHVAAKAEKRALKEAKRAKEREVSKLKRSPPRRDTSS